ncbi:hypothetical protein A3Q56_06487 [Intoshia linei]|uniref:Transporter n=1 Tax=Intoshia linei TaxID=1819745 RepID=A0A177AW37_9BILA|nr:hypothetical protein A3Q56_06487 [Intoshia linei]
MKIQLKSLITKNSESSGVNKEGSLETDSSSEYTRESWGSRFEFLFSCIGYAVGLGNIWRFPYLCYENGGGEYKIKFEQKFKVSYLKKYGHNVCSRHNGGVNKEGSLETDSSSEYTRESWGSRFEFLFSCIGYAVGLGNIWRFPYLCYENGGAAFLIPYFCCLIVCGIPMFLLEISFGQFSSNSPIKVWRISPIFRGVGYGLIMTSSIVCIYYNVIMAWALYYFIASFSSTLPWAVAANNYTSSFNASLIYWQNTVLIQSDSLSAMSTVNWKLLGCLFLVWIVTSLCVVKGVSLSGKIMYVTSTMPYIIILIFIVRSSLLVGAGNGLYYYVVPDSSKISNPRVWFKAANQIFFSLGPGLGLGLVFVAYPATIAKMGYAQFWSILFFLNILLVGLDSIFLVNSGGYVKFNNIDYNDVTAPGLLCTVPSTVYPYTFYLLSNSIS